MSETKHTHTPGPWGYVPSNKNHGPYVTNEWGSGDICDCYTMSKPSELAVCNGGTSEPIHFQHEEADANARLIASAPDLLALVYQYRDDLRHPPAPDSRERRLEAIEAAISKAEGSLT